MKRIVYIIPDSAYGNSFNFLKDRYYKKYDITYSQLKLHEKTENRLISVADSKFKFLMEYVNAHPQNATLFLDNLKDFLGVCYDEFLKLTESDLQSSGQEKVKNAKTLLDLQLKLK